MTSTSATRPLLTLTGVVACLLLLLSACGQESAPTTRPEKSVSDLAAHAESEVRAALAAVDACSLLLAAGIEGRPGLHSCSKLGADAVELNLGVPLADHQDDGLTTVGGVQAVEVDDDPCRILLPASTSTAIEVVADDCDSAREVAASVVAQLDSEDVEQLSGVAAHDACALLEAASGGAETDLTARSLETCSLATETSQSDPSDDGSSDRDQPDLGVGDGTALTIRELAQTPQQLRDSWPGSRLVDVAGRPTILATMEGACWVQVRPDPVSAPDNQTSPFAQVSTWVQLRSTDHDCTELREWTQRLVQAAATAPTAPTVSSLLYPAGD